MRKFNNFFGVTDDLNCFHCLYPNLLGDLASGELLQRRFYLDGWMDGWKGGKESDRCQDITIKRKTGTQKLLILFVRSWRTHTLSKRTVSWVVRSCCNNRWIPISLNFAWRSRAPSSSDRNRLQTQNTAAICNGSRQTTRCLIELVGLGWPTQKPCSILHTEFSHNAYFYISVPISTTNVMAPSGSTLAILIPIHGDRWE